MVLLEALAVEDVMVVGSVRARVVVALGCVSALVAACSSYEGDGKEEKTRSAAAALSFSDGNDDGYCASNSSAQCWHGTPVAPKQLVLTFDDGPGSQSLELSSWLRSRGIRATFFVNGHCFGSSANNFGQCQQNGDASASDLLSQVVADGHLVGNHTQDHYDLTSLDDGSILAELRDTDAIISPFVANGHYVFRAPYGSWSSHDYDVLQSSAMSKYVGPVKWDIGGAMTSSGYAADWDCWQNTNGYGVMTTKECGDRYLHEIDDVGRGIILMHDADYGDVSNHDLTNGKGNTIDMIKYMIDGNAQFGVPGLVAQGYTFLRLDEVPDIASALGGGGGCVPSCGGHDCGGDGCGGSCGTCASGQTCNAGTCTASSSDAGAGGSCTFDPTWQQQDANEWWVEYAISGSVASASFEVVGGPTFALSSNWGKWVGSSPVQVSSGTQVVVHAKSTSGDSAQTQAFPYLVTTNPKTSCSSGGGACVPSCGGHDCGGDGCGGSCGTCASGQTCNAGTCTASSSDAGADSGGADGGTKCSATFNPTWSEGEANSWWVEYVISGSVASAYLEVVGGQTVTLSADWGEWVGPTNASIPKGTSVIVHATSTSGETAQTKPFAYLTVTNPVTACTP
jgi:peptidoglycan/xylan/chitin deacetylase (PgdA/CDA1 family)